MTKIFRIQKVTNASIQKAMSNIDSSGLPRFVNVLRLLAQLKELTPKWSKSQSWSLPFRTSLDQSGSIWCGSIVDRELPTGPNSIRPIVGPVPITHKKHLDKLKNPKLPVTGMISSTASGEMFDGQKQKLRVYSRMPTRVKNRPKRPD